MSLFHAMATGLLQLLRLKMANSGFPNKFPKVAYILGATPFILSLFLAQFIRLEEQSKIRALVESCSSRLQVKISETVENQVLALVRMARRFERMPYVDMVDLTADADDLLDHFPNFSSIVLTNENFRVRFFRTLRNTQRAFPPGTDIAFTPERREAMERTRDTGNVTASASFELQVAKTTGFFVPLRINREGAFFGLLIGYFRTAELIHPIIADSQFKEFGIKIEDASKVLFESDPQSDSPDSNFISSLEIPVYGRSWTLKMWPLPLSLERTRSSIPGMTVAMGFGTSAFLFLVLFLGQKSTSKQKIAEEATQRYRSQIHETHRALQLVQERQHLLDQIASTAPHLISVYDVKKRRILYASRAVETVLGISHAKLLELEMGKFVFAVHPDDQKVVRNAHERLMGTPSPNSLMNSASESFVDSEYRIQNSAGNWLWVANRLAVFLRNEQGEVLQTISASLDNTARKNFEFELGAREEASRRLCEISSDLSLEFDALITKLVSLGCEFYGLEYGGC